MTATNTSSAATTVEGDSSFNRYLKVTSITGAVSNGRGGVRLNTTPLVGKQPGAPGIAPATETPAGGYLPLDGFGIPAQPIGDEEALYFDTPEFVYAGEKYTSIGVDSNGYLLVGGGTDTSADIVCCPPQTLPDPAPPNNVLAPFWSDLDGTGAPGVFIGTLTDGVDQLARRRVAGQRIRHEQPEGLPDLDRAERHGGHHLHLRPGQPAVGADRRGPHRGRRERGRLRPVRTSTARRRRISGSPVSAGTTAAASPIPSRSAA